MKLMYESAGDVVLYKFKLYIMPRQEGVCESDYDDNLKGYLFYESYKYNTITKQTEDDFITHADIIDSVPYVIKRSAEYDISGKTDYNSSGRFVESPVRIWFTGDVEKLSNRDKKYLATLFDADIIL